MSYKQITPIPVSTGGTGASTLTDGGVLVGSGTSAITALAVAASNTVLQGNTASDPSFTGSPSVSGTVTAATGLIATTGGVNATGNSLLNGGTVGIGTDNASNAITIGTGTVARLINIGLSAAPHVINVGVNNGASSLGLNAGTGNMTLISGGSIGLDGAGVVELNSTGGAISIGNDANAQAINIGTGAAARTITVGNTTGATDLDLRCGTGDFTLASATGTIINALDTGEITMPLQPAFLATVGSAITNVTGAGTSYVLIATTEIFDQNSDYNNTTGLFTAPVTGRYQLSCSIILNEITAAMTDSLIQIQTSNRDYSNGILNVGAIRAVGAINDRMTWPFTVLADMDAGDTSNVRIRVSQGAGDTADVGSSTSFSGFLAC